RRQRGARAPALGAAPGTRDASGRRPTGRDLVPLSRGPYREAVLRRGGEPLRLPAEGADLRLRPRADARAGHAQGGHGQPGRGGRQPAQPQRQAARRAAGRGAGLMAALTLDYLLRHAGPARLAGPAPADATFSSITNHSGEATPGALFLAIEAARDGHDFIVA